MLSAPVPVRYYTAWMMLRQICLRHECWFSPMTHTSISVTAKPRTICLPLSKKKKTKQRSAADITGCLFQTRDSM